MKITEEKVDQLASLAKLSFDGESKTAMMKDLDNILAMCEKLNEVNTQGVEPLIYMTENENQWREDIVNQEITHEEALKNAPKKDSDFFRVPKYIDQNAE